MAQAEKQVAAADARVAQAKANAQKAQDWTWTATRRWWQKDVISKQQFDQAVAGVRRRRRPLVDRGTSAM